MVAADRCSIAAASVAVILDDHTSSRPCPPHPATDPVDGQGMTSQTVIPSRSGTSSGPTFPS
jgi:hypothetical protein